MYGLGYYAWVWPGLLYMGCDLGYSQSEALHVPVISSRTCTTMSWIRTCMCSMVGPQGGGGAPMKPMNPHNIACAAST